MNSDSSVTTVRCNGCGEWYDARAGSCYLCGVERPDHNTALVRAAHESRLSDNLGKQMQGVSAEARATQMVSSRSMDGRRGTQGVYPGAGGLEKSIREQLKSVGMLA